jgi:hypothetical protein
MASHLPAGIDRTEVQPLPRALERGHPGPGRHALMTGGLLLVPSSGESAVSPTGRVVSAGGLVYVVPRGPG